MLLGLGLCGVAAGAVLYSLYWGLQALLCPTHLGMPLESVLLRADLWDRQVAPTFYASFVRARSHVRRQALGLVLLLALAGWWLRDPPEGWLLAVTVVTACTLLADARVMALLRQDSQVMAEITEARREMEGMRR